MVRNLTPDPLLCQGIAAEGAGREMYRSGTRVYNLGMALYHQNMRMYDQNMALYH